LLEITHFNTPGEVSALEAHVIDNLQTAFNPLIEFMWVLSIGIEFHTVLSDDYWFFCQINTKSVERFV